jgi:hypothetical protein
MGKLEILPSIPRGFAHEFHDLMVAGIGDLGCRATSAIAHGLFRPAVPAARISGLLMRVEIVMRLPPNSPQTTGAGSPSSYDNSIHPDRVGFAAGAEMAVGERSAPDGCTNRKIDPSSGSTLLLRPLIAIAGAGPAQQTTDDGLRPKTLHAIDRGGSGRKQMLPGIDGDGSAGPASDTVPRWPLGRQVIRGAVHRW